MQSIEIVTSGWIPHSNPVGTSVPFRAFSWFSFTLTQVKLGFPTTLKIIKLVQLETSIVPAKLLPSIVRLINSLLLDKSIVLRLLLLALNSFI